MQAYSLKDFASPTLSVDPDLAALTFLIRQTHCTPDGLRAILARLAGIGQLTHRDLPSLVGRRSLEAAAPGAGSQRTRRCWC